MTMKDFMDKIILFFCCMALYLCAPSSPMSVVPTLIAIIATSLCSYFDDKEIFTAIIVIFIVLCMVVPGLTMFLPLICYDCFFRKAQFVAVLALIPLISFSQSAPILVSAITFVMLILSILLKYFMVTQVKLKADYTDLRDTTKEMAIQLKRQNSDLLEKQDYEINIATLNERNRIARDIHDNVGHLLSSSILQVGALLAINKDEKVKENLLVVKDILSQAMDSIRTSVHELYDESIDLYAQVSELVQKFTFCHVNFDYDIQSNPDKKLKYAFISIVKEALSNIIKHSDASLVCITFREHPALYQLIISDNGTVKKYDMDNGIGLKNITDRVNSFHGNINISVKNGFEIFISIPKEETIS